MAGYLDRRVSAPGYRASISSTGTRAVVWVRYTFTLGPAGTTHSPPTHTAFRSRTGRSTVATFRCHRPVNGQSGSGESTLSGSAEAGRPEFRDESAVVTPPVSGPKQLTTASATDVWPATA